MKSNRKKIFDNFNKYINEQDADPHDVCMFSFSLLKEKGYKYAPSKCDPEWTLINTMGSEG